MNEKERIEKRKILSYSAEKKNNVWIGERYEGRYGESRYTATIVSEKEVINSQKELLQKKRKLRLPAEMEIEYRSEDDEIIEVNIID